MGTGEPVTHGLSLHSRCSLRLADPSDRHFPRPCREGRVPRVNSLSWRRCAVPGTWIFLNSIFEIAAYGEF